MNCGSYFSKGVKKDCERGEQKFGLLRVYCRRGGKGREGRGSFWFGTVLSGSSI